MVKTICIPKKYHNPNAHFNIIIKIQSRAQKSKSAFRAIQSNRENSKITNVHLATILNLAKTTTRRQRWFVLMKAETKNRNQAQSADGLLITGACARITDSCFPCACRASFFWRCLRICQCSVWCWHSRIINSILASSEANGSGSRILSFSSHPVPSDG